MSACAPLAGGARIAVQFVLNSPAATSDDRATEFGECLAQIACITRSRLDALVG